jgi:hypothetical protein
MTQTSQNQVFDNELKQKKRQTLILKLTIIFVLLIAVRRFISSAITRRR